MCLHEDAARSGQGTCPSMRAARWRNGALTPLDLTRWRLCPAPATAHGAAAPARSGMSVRPVPVSTGLESAQLGEDGDHMRPIEFEIERTVRAPIEDVFAR